MAARKRDARRSQAAAQRALRRAGEERSPSAAGSLLQVGPSTGQAEAMDLTKLPLQTGATALSRVVLGTITLVIGLGLFGEWTRAGDETLVFSFFYVYFLPIIAVILRAMLGSERASDVRLLPEEMQVDGGPHHGVRVRWPMIAEVSVRRGRLHLDLGDGVKLDLAHANNEIERGSLDALGDVLRSQRRRAASGSARSAPAPPVPSLVTCPSCGAPAAIADAAEVSCDACGADVPIPPAVRARFAAARGREASRAATLRAVAALFHQPSSQRVNGLLAALSVLGLGWLPIAAGSTGFGPTVMVSLALFIAGALALRVVIANRRALSVVCLGFAARPDGHGPACRSCGAPLPRSAVSEVVATCAYCDAQNVVGAPAAAGGGTATDADRLDRALAARDRSVRAAVVAAVVGLGLVGIALAGALALRRPDPPARPRPVVDLPLALPSTR